MSAKLNVTHLTAEIHQIKQPIRLLTLDALENLHIGQRPVKQAYAMVVSCPPIEKMSCPIHLYFGIFQASLLEIIRFLIYTIRNFNRTFNELIVNFL